MFIGLLTDLMNESNPARCISLSNQKCMIEPSLINLHPNEYTQELHYYPFAAKLNRCVGSCSTLNDLSNKVCVPEKTKDFTTHVFNMIAGIFSTKVILRKCKLKFDGRKCNSNQKWNDGKCRCESKKHDICEKIYIRKPNTCSCENGKNLANVTNDSLIRVMKL